MKIEYFSYPGSYHAEHGMPNEDHVGIAKNNNNISVTVVCDGAGGHGAGGIAAELLSGKLADYVLDKFDVLYSSSSEKAKYNMICYIEDCLSEYSNNNNIAIEELATTIMIAAMDSSDGRCICFHLGDGIILREHKYGLIDVVSSPRNGISKHTTYLTGNCNLWRHLSFYRWRESNINKIILLTDGAMDHLVTLTDHNGWQYQNYCPTIVEDIERHLLCQNPQDDFSCAIITRR